MIRANVTTAPEEAPETPATERACLNCGEVANLRARYCSGCGQRLGDSLLTVRVFLKEILEEGLALDGRLPRTVGMLFTRPGRLTREYAAGRVVRYVRPFKLYVASSILFFLVLSLSIGSAIPKDFEVQRTNAGADTEAPAEATDEGGARETAGEVVSQEVAGGGGPEGATVSRESAGAEAPPETEADAVSEVTNTTSDSGAGSGRVANRSGPPAFVQNVMESFVESVSEDPRISVRRFTERMLQDTPKAVIVLLPIFAFILKLLYIRRRRLYVEHLVFVLHVHAFGFLLAIPLILAPDSWPTGLIWLFLPIYLFWAMKQVYGQSWLKTAVKFSIFGGAYLISVIATLLTVVIVAAIAVGRG